MRKNVFGRQFKRDKNERKALFKGLMSALILNDRIQTTEEKAKAIKGQVEKLVTKARIKEANAQRVLEKHLSPNAIKKLINDVAPRFTDRNGGYTRILKLGNRLSDNAKMVMIEWVEIDNSKFKIKSSKLEGSENKTEEEKEASIKKERKKDEKKNSTKAQKATRKRKI